MHQQKRAVDSFVFCVCLPLNHWEDEMTGLEHLEATLPS